MISILPPKAEPLHPLAHRSVLAQGAFAATVAVKAAGLWLGVRLAQLFRALAAGATADEAELARLDGLTTLIDVLELLLLLVTAVLFLRWLHRARVNLDGAGLPGLAYRPGRAVASFFIPFVNLIRPYRVMRETWSASEGLAAGQGPGLWPDDAGDAWVVGLWWTAFVTGGGLARAAAVSVAGAESLAEYQRYASFIVASAGVSMVAALCAWRMVRVITQWQEQARARTPSFPAIPGGALQS